ncbi:hypothetical protein ELI49_29675 (plasmid) [Rhizobium ruizarguesonis]|nr:hypothetical protein [Rhizobium ruizarguesonis]TAT97902.1 hypothetical protein ELI49_29675 [Rhizobium ruizarguesonis]
MSQGYTCRWPDRIASDASTGPALPSHDPATASNPQGMFGKHDLSTLRLVTSRAVVFAPFSQNSSECVLAGLAQLWETPMAKLPDGFSLQALPIESALAEGRTEDAKTAVVAILLTGKADKVVQRLAAEMIKPPKRTGQDC